MFNTAASTFNCWWKQFKLLVETQVQISNCTYTCSSGLSVEPFTLFFHSCQIAEADNSEDLFKLTFNFKSLKMFYIK